MSDCSSAFAKICSALPEANEKLSHPSGWIGVVLDTNPDWDMVTTMVRDAYLFVATAKLRKLI